MGMSYIYCDACRIGFHSNVRSCPECGQTVRRTYERDPSVHHRHRPSRSGSRPLREDVENEVRAAIYGWRSGAVDVERAAGG
jgi:predicted  nucleic acid-binding Zn-ribbon protein